MSKETTCEPVNEPVNEPGSKVGITQPCPFCGESCDDVVAVYLSAKHYLECNSCGARGPLSGTGDNAIRLWNLRGDP